MWLRVLVLWYALRRSLHERRSFSHGVSVLDRVRLVRGKGECGVHQIDDNGDVIISWLHQLTRFHVRYCQALVTLYIRVLIQLARYHQRHSIMSWVACDHICTGIRLLSDQITDQYSLCVVTISCHQSVITPWRLTKRNRTIYSLQYGFWSMLGGVAVRHVT